MLVESHPQYNLMLASSFNLTHPLVNNIISASQLVLMSTVSTGPYLNAGVFIVDAVLWRKHHITTLAEEIMTENANGSIFATNAGDQGVFYLLSEKYIFGLEARWNMRRLPKKTVLMLEKRTNQGVFTTGIVHFAGSTGGDATRLCRKPYYPLFKNAVQPLYLSVVSSFQRAFPDLFSSCDDLYIVCATCREILKKEVKEEMYNPGKGNFRWPPL